jgi:hypothetical protein
MSVAKVRISGAEVSLGFQKQREISAAQKAGEYQTACNVQVSISGGDLRPGDQVDLFFTRGECFMPKGASAAPLVKESTEVASLTFNGQTFEGRLGDVLLAAQGEAGVTSTWHKLSVRVNQKDWLQDSSSESDFKVDLLHGQQQQRQQ